MANKEDKARALAQHAHLVTLKTQTKDAIRGACGLDLTTDDLGLLLETLEHYELKLHHILVGRVAAQ